MSQSSKTRRSTIEKLSINGLVEVYNRATGKQRSRFANREQGLRAVAKLQPKTEVNTIAREVLDEGFASRETTNRFGPCGVSA